MSIVKYEKRGFVGTEAAVLMQGRGTDFLQLGLLEEGRKRLDGKVGTHFVEYRWLSKPCVDPGDEAYVCVKGSDYILLTRSEAAEVKRKVKAGQTLFDLFNFWG